EGRDHARLAERVLSADECPPRAADRRAQVLDLEDVRVGGRDRHLPTVEHEGPGPARPRIAQEEGPPAPDRLERSVVRLEPRRERGREPAREPEHAREPDVDACGTDELLPKDRHRLTPGGAPGAAPA